MQWVLILVAKVQGKEITELPKDLYIPPDAMLVILEMFEGPLDLLLYLIRKHNLNIVDIPVASITKQYVEYVDYMQCVNLELASDYLEMAAILAEIKSRMLLPVLPLEHSEEDPRAELVRRLQEYEQIKQAAANLDAIPRQERDFFLTQFNVGNKYITTKQPQIQFKELLLALEQVLKNQDLRGAHTIVGENLSVRDKMTAILSTLQSLQSISFADQQVQDVAGEKNKFFMFSDLFNFKEGRLGIVVTFLAILELVRENLLEIMQSDHISPIYIRLI